MFCARPQATEASAKMMTPLTKTLRRPNKSPAAPPTRISAPSKRPYDSTTHCTSMTVALNVAWSAGNATFTTVLSMKAMLVPRIAAARIQGPDWGAHGVLSAPDRMAASSQGGFMQVLRMRSEGKTVRWKSQFCGEKPPKLSRSRSGFRKRAQTHAERLNFAALKTIREKACPSRLDSGATMNYGLVITSLGALGRRKCTPRSRLASRVAGRLRSATKIFFDHEPLVQ